MKIEHVKFEDIKRLNDGQKAFLKCILTVKGKTMEQVGKILKAKYGKGSRSLVCTALTFGKDFYSPKVTTEILSFIDPTLENIDFFLYIGNNWFTYLLHIVKHINIHENILSNISGNVNQKIVDWEKKVISKTVG